MPGRLIAFIFVLFIIIAFIGFNADNTTDIRIWFGDKGVLMDVRIFVSFFVMYLIGVLSALPFILVWNRKKTRKIRNAAVAKSRHSRRRGAAPRGSRARKSRAPRLPGDDASSEEDEGVSEESGGNDEKNED